MKNDQIKANEFYTLLFNCREEIHSKMTKNSDLSNLTNEDLITNSEKSYFTQIINDKQHYLTILLYNLYKNNNNELPELQKLLSSNFPKHLNSENYNIPRNCVGRNFIKSFKSFYEEEKNRNSTLFDIISFSTIPSLFSMYLEKNKFEDFLEFINELKDVGDQNLQILFSRSIFISPMFLNFTQKAFYPIFKEFYNNQRPFLEDQFYEEKNIQNVQSQILNSIKSNLEYLPLYIVKFLEEFKKQSLNYIFLKNNFFDLMIKDPSLFLVIDPWISDIKKYSDRLTKILTFIFNDKMIKDILDVFLKTRDEKLLDSMFCKKDVKITYYSVIDSIDKAVFSLFYDNNDKRCQKTNISDVLDALNLKKGSYDLFSACLNRQESIGRLNDSMVADGLHSFLYKMLKYSPPLPVGVTFTEDSILTPTLLKKILRKYIIDVCDPSVRACLLYYFNYIFSTFIKKGKPISRRQIETNGLKKINFAYSAQLNEINSNIEIDSLLSKSLERKKIIIELSLNNIYTFITNKLTSETSKTENILIIPSRVGDIIKDPAGFNKQWIEYYEKAIKLTENINGLFSLKAILYHRFSRNLRFYNFLSLRPDLIRYDQALSQFMSQNFQSLLSNFAHINKMCVFEYQKAACLFKSAFNENCDPLQKFLLISDAEDEMYLTFYNIHKKLISAEDRSPLFDLLMLYSNPPHFISNIVYLCEFLYSIEDHQLTKIDGMIKNKIVSLANFITNLNKNKQFNLPINIYSLSRNLLKNINLIITGNDPLIAAVTYQVFIDSSKNQCIKPISDYMNDKTVKDIANQIGNNREASSRLQIKNTTSFFDIDLKVINNFTDSAKNTNNRVIYASKGDIGKFKLAFLKQNTNILFFAIPDDVNPRTNQVKFVKASNAFNEFLKKC